MGIEGAGSLERLGREIVFFYRKFKENGSFRPISYINFEVAASYGVEDDTITLK